MKDPTDPINVRQARQGKPVLVILAVSMVLAIIAAWVLWGAIAEDTGDEVIEGAAVSLQIPESGARATA